MVLVRAKEDMKIKFELEPRPEDPPIDNDSSSQTQETIQQIFPEATRGSDDEAGEAAADSAFTTSARRVQSALRSVSSAA